MLKSIQAERLFAGIIFREVSAGWNYANCCFIAVFLRRLKKETDLIVGFLFILRSLIKC